ncbi:aldehyde-activating protein [Vibrio sp. SCSIO 43136]|uniref:GFA family protein n=1 Tax=Vibrio sp. SCSIO 43136 TaxID=2819101 RepID=UPI0020760E3E|nr:aldehyde-activating protein [Vibrio sp. SCSIO 43136]USD64036.1 aldehyde-activating protein [Vibrio sp. SCSIO 43136]
MHTGQCHCGNVTISISKVTPTAVSCNCSICHRYAAIWGFFTEKEVSLDVGSVGLDTYCHGDKMINFNRCKGCGVVTHYTSTQPSPEARFAVNYRIFHREVLDITKIRLFDGADSWEFIESN